MARQAGHHTVPEFYLKRFGTPRGTDDSRVVAWEKSASTPLPAQRVSNIAKVRDFYTIDGQEGEDAQALERLIARFESGWAEAMIELDRGLPIDTEVRHAVSQFVAFQFCRTTRSRRLITDTESDLVKFAGKMTLAAARAKGGERLVRSAFRSYSDSWDSSDEDTDACIRDIEAADFEVSVGNTTHLQQLTRVLAVDSDYIKWPFCRRWRIMRSTSARFVTSDHPVVLVESRLPHAGLATAEQIVIPLSPEAYLVMERGGVGHSRERRVTDTEVREYNARTIRAADRWVYMHPDTASTDLMPQPPRDSIPSAARRRQIALH